MKKTMAFFVVMLLLIASIPLALADEGSDDMMEDSDNDDNGSVNAEARLKLGASAVRADVQARANGELRNRIIEAKERLVETRQKYLSEREDFLNARAEVRAACADPASDACISARAEVQVKSKEVLIKASDDAIAYLERVKLRLEESDDIDPDVAAKAIAEIDASIDDLVQAKADVEAASTPKELQDAAKEIRAVWKKIRWHASALVAHSIDVRLDVLLNRFDKFSTNLECSINAMQEAGIDTTSLDEVLVEYNANVDAAIDAHDNAHDLVEQARNLDSDTDGAEIRVLLQQAKVQLEIANSKLRSAHANMKVIVKGVKDSGVDVSSCRLTAEAN